MIDIDSKPLSDQYPSRSKADSKSSISGTKIFVGNLAYSTNWQSLKDHMKAAGEIVYVDVFTKPDGKSKGCGIVEYKTTMEAERALQQLHETKLDGRQIYVRESNREERPNKPNDRREKGGSDRRDRDRDRDRDYSRGGDRDRDRDRDRNKRDYRDDKNNSRGQDYSRSRDKKRRSNSGGSDNDRKRDGGNRERGYQIFIKNIPWTVTWQQLKDAFKEFGSIMRANIPQDDKGRSLGYGIVTYEKEQDAKTAIDNMDGATFNERKITVQMKRAPGIGGDKRSN